MSKKEDPHTHNPSWILEGCDIPMAKGYFIAGTTRSWILRQTFILFGVDLQDQTHPSDDPLTLGPAQNTMGHADMWNLLP